MVFPAPPGPVSYPSNLTILANPCLSICRVRTGVRTRIFVRCLAYHHRSGGGVQALDLPVGETRDEHGHEVGDEACAFGVSHATSSGRTDWARRRTAISQYSSTTSHAIQRRP